MSRNWLLRSLLVGIVVVGCSSSGSPVSESSGDASPPPGGGADAGHDATIPFEASDEDVAAPGADAGGIVDSSGIDGGAPGVTPSSLAFGMVNCGSTAAAQTFAVVNPSAYDVTWSASLGLGAMSSFTLSPASGTLTPGQSAHVTVTPNAIPAAATTSSNAFGDVVTVTLNSSSFAVTLTETAQGAVLGFEPSTLPIGPVPLSAGPDVSYFAVQNTGNVPATVALTLTGDPSLSLPGATTTQTLTAPSGATADSTITFTPTTTASVTGSVALALVGTPSLCGPLPPALAISGTGTNGQVGVSPSTIVFGNGGLVPCGTNAQPSTVMIQNTGTASFTWTGTLTHGGSFYSITPASGTLQPLTSVSVTVTPKAIPASSTTLPGGYDDTLTIATSVVGDSPHTVSLQETAQGAIISRSTGSLGFGNVGIGVTSTNTNTVSFANTGNVSATLTFANGNEAAFMQPSSLTVGAGSFAIEPVSFLPTEAEPYTDLGTVALAPTAVPDDAGAGDAGATFVPLCGALPGNLTLTGTGTIPTVTATPGSLNFGYVPCGDAGTPLEVTITNTGPPTTFTASLLKGTYFGVSPTAGAFDGGTAQLTVTPFGLPIPAFNTPNTTTSGYYNDTLQVVTGNNNILDVTLSMSALGAILTFSPASLPFGTVDSGATATLTVTVTNNGSSPANVVLTPAPTPTFGVPQPTATIPAGGGAYPFTVTFSPPDPGSYDAGTIAITVTSTFMCGPPAANVTMNGKGD
jgi:hypothetical protein